ncbi:MAG: GNAT family N-acetyltransferase [Aureliella sp.]
MTIEIRKLNSQDALPFREFRVAALRESPDRFGEDASEMEAHSNELVAALLAAPSTSVFGALLNNEIVGSIGMHSQNRIKTKHIAHLWGMYVSPPNRNEGIARRLVQFLLNEAKAMPQIEQVKLSVVTQNAAAIKLYESFGFEIYGTDMNAIKSGGNYLDEHLMVLRF